MNELLGGCRKRWRAFVCRYLDHRPIVEGRFRQGTTCYTMFDVRNIERRNHCGRCGVQLTSWHHRKAKPEELA